MLNNYERDRQLKRAAHNNMSRCPVDPSADQAFRRSAYRDGPAEVRVDIKEALADIRRYSFRLDDWERETIRRIAERIKKESD
ncbi:hypothetical protein [Diplocloster modestus]|uniref:Uncharacterized protein n=1 Tax=Diplocloster modestus TaxID=2850322 RepID=A0ABS6K2M1_9FIRM|nr:hypothetical protein [Diplocloster modestus]MBU9724425.1 hypothetical protein [Diplocloster modestus]